jgi:hypothetical protein
MVKTLEILVANLTRHATTALQIDMEDEEFFDEMDSNPVFINGIPCFNEHDALEAGKQTPPGQHIR